MKLSCVATDVLDVSGRLTLEALCPEPRPRRFCADLARGGTTGKKLPALREALAGDFKAHHALIVADILAHIDYLDEAIATLTWEVEQRLTVRAQGAAAGNDRWCRCPDSTRDPRRSLGPDMSRFPTDRHAASWTAICPATTNPPDSANQDGRATATRTCRPR